MEPHGPFASQSPASNPPLQGLEDGSSSAAQPRKFQAAEVYPIIEGKLFFTAHWCDEQTNLEIQRNRWNFYFSSECQEMYEPFCADFGPVNLASVYHFCNKITDMMQEPRLGERPRIYYCSMENDHLTNMAFLFGCYLVLVEGWSVERAIAPFQNFTRESDPFLPYRDATFVTSTYDLHLKDCLLGLSKAASQGWFNLATFDVANYLFLDFPGNADMHVIANKFVAFKGPRDDDQQAFTFSPKHYIPLFKDLQVEAVIRLNEPDTYDATQFTQAGIAHYDLHFADCSVPPASIWRKFLQIVDEHPGKVAVHCLAGLGRTGTLIGIWLMCHFEFTADEVMGYLRITRPGSVIGPQQQFLKQLDRNHFFQDGRQPASNCSQEVLEPSSSIYDHRYSAMLASQVRDAVIARAGGS